MNNDISILQQMAKTIDGKNNIEQWFKTLEQARKEIIDNHEEKQKEKSFFDRYIAPAIINGTEQAIISALVKETKAEIDIDL